MVDGARPIRHRRSAVADTAEEALSRLTRLIRLDVFRGAPSTETLIAAGLRSTTARIVSDAANASTFAGQTAIVTLHNQLLMLGLQIEVDVPDQSLVAEQPPLVGTALATALADYAADLIPGGSASPAEVADIVFVIGDTPYIGPAVRVSGNAMRGYAGPDVPNETVHWSGASPFGAIAAAAAAAADGVRVAIPHIAAHLGRPAVTDSPWAFSEARSAQIDMSRYGDLSSIQLGSVDVVSGGAISSAALYTLLRAPDVRGQLRVIEPDVLDVSNLNRYPLARLSQVGQSKASLLAAFGGDRLRLAPIPHILDAATVATIGPLAPRVLVGVDHIPSRWLTQRNTANGTVFVGATSHDFVYNSVHPPGMPCAGCAHPKADPSRDLIPTMSFVSLWAGLIQAMDLLKHAGAGSLVHLDATYAWPLALESQRGLHSFVLGTSPNCPVGCEASRRGSGPAD